jgi:hypothetical protein
LALNIRIKLRALAITSKAAEALIALPVVELLQGRALRV